MANKSRKVRVSKPRDQLTKERKYNLVGGMGEFLTRRDDGGSHFDSEEQRRSLYFANKEYLFKECMKSCGERWEGVRPNGFWDYEVELKEGEHPHEYMIRNNLFLPGELETIKSRWIEGLKLEQNYLEMMYEYYIKGEEPMHKAKPWPERVEEWEPMAKMYGGEPLKAWNDFVTYLKAKHGTRKTEIKNIDDYRKE